MIGIESKKKRQVDKLGKIEEGSICWRQKEMAVVLIEARARGRGEDKKTRDYRLSDKTWLRELENVKNVLEHDKYTTSDKQFLLPAL